jgi:regulation of enolase protein 1 (concanavalin A-like superfamily)
MIEGSQWLNEPQQWSKEAGQLTIVTDGRTDFWRETHYGFTRHTGHALLAASDGDFTAEFRVQGDYQALYDQAGLMVLLDERNWLKAGIEHSDGAATLGSVLTRGQSDWATGPFPGNPADFRMRVTVERGVLRIQASTDSRNWPLVRLCPFPEAGSYRVGPMCCSPERAGLKVRFSEWRIGRPLGKDLHDLS